MMPYRIYFRSISALMHPKYIRYGYTLRTAVVFYYRISCAYYILCFCDLIFKSQQYFSCHWWFQQADSVLSICFLIIYSPRVVSSPISQLIDFIYFQAFFKTFQLLSIEDPEMLRWWFLLACADTRVSLSISFMRLNSNSHSVTLNFEKIYTPLALYMVPE